MHCECINLPYSVFKKATQDEDSKFYCKSCKEDVSALGVQADKYGFVTGSRSSKSSRQRTLVTEGLQSERKSVDMKADRAPEWMNEFVMIRAMSVDDARLADAICSAAKLCQFSEVYEDVKQAVSLVDIDLVCFSSFCNISCYCCCVFELLRPCRLYVARHVPSSWLLHLSSTTVM